MKKAFPICILLAVLALVASSFVKANVNSSRSTSPMQKYTITVNENNEIVSMTSSSTGAYAWHIIDLSGPTNIRQSPKGKVCMKLKAYTQYDIYASGSKDGWLCISSIYNCREGYWVRLHSSKTGTYWIAQSILY